MSLYIVFLTFKDKKIEIETSEIEDITGIEHLANVLFMNTLFYKLIYKIEPVYEIDKEEYKRVRYLLDYNKVSVFLRMYNKHNEKYMLIGFSKNPEKLKENIERLGFDVYIK